MIILNEVEGNEPQKKVRRENIYAGVLLNPFELVTFAIDATGKEIPEEEFEERGIIKPNVTGGLVCRKMLFEKTEEDVANDLLYYSPKYQIEGFTPKIEVDKNFIITHPIGMEELLMYFNFKMDLTPSDIRRIYGMFLRSFREGFYFKNCELFGYKEDQPEDFTYYEHDEPITDPKRLKAIYAEKRWEQRMGHRSFGYSGKEHPIPSEVWNLKNIANNKKAPSTLEPERGKVKIHTLF